MGKVEKEEDMLQRIRDAAEELEIPESLKPEAVEEMLRSARMGEGSNAADQSVSVIGSSKRKQNQGNRSRRMQRLYAGYVAAAAVAVLVCGTMLFAGVRTNVVSTGEKGSQQEKVAGVQEKAAETNAVDNVSPTTEKAEILRADAGELYQVASDYSQVYDVIIKDYGDVFGYLIVEDFDGAVRKAAVVEESAASGSIMNDAVEMPEMEAVATEKNYSETNVQTEGVDESDIVKTDGAFLYLVKGDEVLIADIRKGAPELLTRVHPGAKSASSDILELYVDNGKMVLIGQEYETALVEETAQPASTEVLKRVVDQKSSRYRTVSRMKTTMYTYSLDHPEGPQLVGQVSVDGSYYTSRKIGDMVYLFTEENMGQRCIEADGEGDDWVPLAGAKKIAADCIYLPEYGSSSLIVASADLSAPDEILDSVMIVNQGANVYVSTEAIYLYHTEWADGAVTEIAKFTFEDGIINATGAASVKGRVSDTFAVNESAGNLRILTCDNFDNAGSSLYILDEKLALVGSLTGIAPGETLYAARFLGDMAYFVTYRNVDPLFAVDLSDPAQPVILGELKITGYSEYLHLWEEEKLVGIGFETDPDSGRREGVKLSMFDAADPAQLTVCDSICITDADYSPAMDQYKSVLADRGRNLIGFMVTQYSKGRENTYLLYQWENGKFENLLTVKLAEDVNDVRGIYAGDYFYIIEEGRILAFDMTKDFERVGELEF